MKKSPNKNFPNGLSEREGVVNRPAIRETRRDLKFGDLLATAKAKASKNKPVFFAVDRA